MVENLTCYKGQVFEMAMQREVSLPLDENTLKRYANLRRCLGVGEGVVEECFMLFLEFSLIRVGFLPRRSGGRSRGGYGRRERFERGPFCQRCATKTERQIGKR